MLSDSCSFDEFANNVHPDDFFDLMYLTELEATEAERWRFRPRAPVGRAQNCGILYAETLKNFLFFMKYGVRPRGIDDALYEAFHAICASYRENNCSGN